MWCVVNIGGWCLQQLYMKVFLIFLLLLLELVRLGQAWFCSAYCKPNMCTGIDKTQCTDCDPPYILNGSTCILDSTLNYFTAADSTNITVSPTGSGSCSVYTFNGPLDSDLAFTLTHTGPITIQHTKIRLILWALMVDQWKPSTDYIESKLVSTGEMYQMNVTLHQAEEDLCYTSKNEWFMKSDYIFSHTDTTNPVVFTVTAKHTGGILRWGIKDYVILAAGCHTYCLACTDLLVTTCQSCNTGYKLSGTTCASSCLAGYGATTDIKVCVLCDVKCAVCYQAFNNCSSCTASVANEAFLIGTQCVNPCPAGYAADTANHTCVACGNSACLSCSATNLSYCYLCNSTTYWYQFDCYSPCPPQTFVNGTNCTACDISCAVCTGAPTPCSTCNTGYKLSGTTCASSCLTQYGPTTDPLVCVLCDVNCTACYQLSTNCSACTTSGVNQAFLLGNQCVNPCPVGYTADTGTHACLLCYNPACTTCNSSDYTICYICNSSTYLLNGDCYNTCPDGYYPNGGNCSLCDVSCSLCTGSPSPCSACNATYFLYASVCGSTCPAGYFGHTGLRQCLDCATSCVTATLTLTLTTPKQLTIDVTFNHAIDFSSFPYQSFLKINTSNITVALSEFAISYQVASDRAYRIVLTPISSTFTMSNVLFTVEANDYSPPHYSQDGYQFSTAVYALIDDIVWDIPLVADETSDLKTLEDINNAINQFFYQPWVQEIKKTGLFALLLPGAQLCSTIILHNATPPANMYEGARLWASFVYFQVPQWEKDGSGLKRFFGDLISTMFNTTSTARMLTTAIQGVDWRFSRTGHTGYFIYDAYIPLILIVVSWIPIVILSRFSSTKPLIRKLKTHFYTALHRIHDICTFYLVLALCLEWTYFQNHTSSTKYISLAFSIVFVAYCLIYEVHAFYQMIPYTYTDIGSTKYNFYVERYSYFLRDLRYEEYGVYARWECNHFLRPYNYQLLSFFRLALILAALPLFQSITYGCISCLIVFQCLQIVRFLLSWPYCSAWRNYYKLALQVALLLIFALYLAADIKYRSNQDSLSLEWMTEYKAIGWTGFFFLFLYNIMYFVYFLIDVVVGCRYTNRQRMEYARNCYYRQMLDQYETYQDISNPTLKQSQAQSFFGSSMASKKNGYINLLNTIHKAQPAIEPGTTKTQKETIELIAHRGNLCEHDYQKYWTVKVKIEQYEIRELGQAKYSINYCKVKDLYMHLHPDMSRKYNVLMPERRTKEVKITPLQNEFYFKLVDNIYKHYSNKTPDTEVVIVKTYQKIDQNVYSPGQKIPIKREDMSQEIQMREIDGHSEKEKLLAVLRGFPVPEELLLLL